MIENQQTDSREEKERDEDQEHVDDYVLVDGDLDDDVLPLLESEGLYLLHIVFVVLEAVPDAPDSWIGDELVLIGEPEVPAGFFVGCVFVDEDVSVEGEES